MTENYSTFTGAIMRPDYSHKIFDDKRLHPFLQVETNTRIRRGAVVGA
ncbi:MAG TPA: hypothetical protein VHE54_17615 [Puia sp.]|nr:hypothetical protein [Puia sp.]